MCAGLRGRGVDRRRQDESLVRAGWHLCYPRDNPINTPDSSQLASWNFQVQVPKVMADNSNLRFDEATQVRPKFICTLFLYLSLFTFSKRELATFIEQEQAQARVQQSIHKFTALCWDK